MDRKALPAPDSAPVEVRVGFVAPRTEMEEEVAAVWRDVLGVERVGVHDNFWELGGHSILATRVLARLSDAFGVDLPLQALFSFPSLGEFSKTIGEAVRAGNGLGAADGLGKGLSGNETMLLKALAGGRSGVPPLVRVRREGEEAPLSFAQERLWFLDHLESGSAYNIPVVLSLHGSGVRVEALAAALNGILRRHEVLRTVFREGAGGEPVQVIRDFAPYALPVVDLAELPDPTAEAARLEQRMATLPFDLAQGPLLTTLLVRVGTAEHRLLASMHHIVFDGWSVGLLVQELSASYRSFCEGLPPALPGLPVQYADYAVWQRRWLSGQVLDAELAWWRERLDGVPASLDLPTDRPRPARRSFRADHYSDYLPPDLVEALTALGRSAEASLFMVLLATFQAFLSRLSGVDDLLVGTPIANRRRLEVENLIGLFVNTLAMRGDFSDDPSFSLHLTRTRDLVLGAYDHQDLPFERLVEALAPERDLSRNPLVQTLLVTGGAPQPSRDLATGLVLDQRGLRTGASKMDLTLYLGQTEDGGMAMGWEFESELFDAPTVARFSGWFHNLLAGLAASPETGVRGLPLLAEAERRQLEAWSGTAARPADEPPTILERFSVWAERAPETVAVISGGTSLSWGEMDLRSARLARSLRRLGAGPETRVAVCLERSTEMLVAILGVLRSGAAYVPLDPDQPAGRRQRILEGSGALALVAGAGLAQEMGNVPGVLVETAAREDGQEDMGAPVDRPDPSSLAYVLYTSGSTGEPKGVGVEHRQLARYMAGVLERLDVPDGSSFATVTTFAADLGHTSVFGALASGGTLHVVPREMAADPARLAGLFEKHPVDVLKIVPSHLAALLAAAPRPERVLPRRRLVVGGEASSWELVDRVRELAPGCRVLNHYGPTETTVGVLTFDLEGKRRGEKVPLGRPLPGTLVRLLDHGLQTVPPGVPGELWVGGAQVARGYLGRPDLTAERFLPDPAGEGARLYRTGDRARWLSSGDLEFLGRADDQVKVRGHRVEPGEVAAMLARHPEVREAAVLPVTRAGEIRLAAYVVTDGEAPSRNGLRAWLVGRLPEPMVPSEIVFLDALPLTSNGKLDRWALSAISALSFQPEPEAGIAPDSAVSPAEELMATVFAELLGCAQVAPADDFFDLGGHSLLAIRLLARVREAFGAELDVRSVFERRTVAGLAARVEEALRGGQSAPPLLPQVGAGTLPLSFAQERLWFLDCLEPGSIAYNVVRELRLRGPLDPVALATALGEVVRRHEPLRTLFAAVDGEPVQLVLPFEPLRLPWIDLSAIPQPARQAEASRLAAAEGQRSFDLRRGPMLRALLLRIAAEEHLLVLGVHHISFDAWSLDVLRRELGALYQAFASGRPSPLPSLPVRYADFAAWQRQWLSGEVLETQLSYWRERLAGSPPSLELPLDRSRPAVQSLRGGFVQEVLPSGLLEELEGLGRRCRSTLFMTLLAAFQALLQRLTGQDDFLVGTPVANRSRSEVQGLIGFFVNTLVLRADLSGDPAFPAIVARVRETALQAYAHQDLPFERLVLELAEGRDLSRTPLFQVVFSWQSARFDRPGESELAPGLGLEIADVASGTSKFDLSLFLGDTREGLAAVAEYAADLFDGSSVQRWIGHLKVLLQGITADPDAPVSSLPLLTPAELRQLTTEWNRTAEPIPDEPVHHLVRRWAERVPEALALSWKGGQLTYGELIRRSGVLGKRLRRQGVGPEAVVALCLERSPDLIIAALAVLEAGGAYLPIDPAHPAERLAWILEDSGAALLLTSDSLTTDEIQGADEPGDEAPRSDLAYVIYTSGSTGLPKGTELRHRGLSNLVSWHGRTCGLEPGDRCTLLAGPGFDASVWETWAPLTAGASLHLPPPEIVLQPRALLAWMAEQGITVSFLPTPLAEAVLIEELPEQLVLRTLLTGGDRLLRRPAPDAPFELINCYGPTESTVVATAGRVVPVREGEGERAPGIGFPIANTRVYILDRHLQPVPVGVPGELYLAGEGLARGYRGRPELTAERFVPNPFGDFGGERLYRTGDLARLLPSGQIEFQGRTDHQVKIRGFRIELGEIEAALAAHPDVDTGVVVVREDIPGDRRLVAYLVPGSESLPESAALRAFLDSRLPAYMIPAAFVLLSGLPLTPNGKVDRRALPAPDLPERGEDFILPRTPLEEQVAEVWREVLGVERIGIGDSFWDLGGHSLLATKVLSRLQEALGTDLPLQSLFESPTLAGFTEAVGRHALAESEGSPDLEDLLAELEGLSEVEVRALLEREVGDSR